ncbi:MULTISPECIES: NADH-quinone oxidoreductase subunit C [unclassified Streptomyces]|uniref:NADH-quinone oxidoreductase subunit C n=1 Tax=unclassified Streptomyces TaxID=2593676 RepID=UPI002E124371|nr:NADH-quinone oxidoreductase subunit C [Streptomyces sp. NBC_01186]WSS43153.1 NADH-quinone oxidoreductase subunit C [Streptomyces sp. NBC_01187]
MTAPAEHPGWLPRAADDLFGEGATAEHAYELLTVDVPAEVWIAALTTARDELGCTFFDWLSAVDEPGTGFRVCAHLVALPTADGTGVRRLVVRTTVPHEAPALPTATGVYAGAAWHERETHEMFGVDFPGHPHLVPLLLPDTFEGHPLRKDFVLAARVAKAWPGAKEPGESGHGGPKRRQMLPPGVPDPNEWGPLKGQLPPAPARERTRRTATRDTPRRARSASAGSTSQQKPAEPAEPTEPPAPTAPTGSEEKPAASASEPRAPESPTPEPPAPEQSATSRDKASGAQAPRSTDAPWHHAAEAPAPEAPPAPAPEASLAPEVDGDSKASPAPEADGDSEISPPAEAAGDAETPAEAAGDAGKRDEDRRDED